MLDHILVPLDGSTLAECVLPHVAAIVGACGSRITLLYVLERNRTVSRRHLEPLTWRVHEAEAKIYLGEVANRLDRAGLQAQVAVLEGVAASRIIEFAHSKSVDLLVLCTHGRSGPSIWNVSGTVRKVIQLACIPVLLIRAQQSVAGDLKERPIRRMLVPLDGSPRAECVLPLATTLARSHDAELLLAHVVRPPQLPRQVPVDSKELELANRLTECNSREAERYLKHCSSELGLPRRTSVLVADNVAVALHDLVRRESVDLVVLSAHGLSGSRRWPYGSTAVNFIAYGTSPLIIVQDLSVTRAQPRLADTAVARKGMRRTRAYTADQPVPIPWSVRSWGSGETPPARPEQNAG